MPDKVNLSHDNYLVHSDKPCFLSADGRKLTAESSLIKKGGIASAGVNRV